MDTNNYKFSNYNFYIPISNYNILLIYNSISNTLIEVNGEIGKHLMNMSQNKNILSNNNFISNIDFELLIKDKVILPSYIDEKNIIFERYSNLKKKVYNDGEFSLVIAPTNRCNMECLYCFEGEKCGKYLTQDIIDKLIGKIDAELKCPKIKISNLHVTWYGGEPLLYPQIIDNISKRLMDLCDKYNIVYTPCALITNGSLLNEEVWEILIRNKIKKLQVSLDGSEKTHNKKRPLRNKDNSYQIILNNLRKLPENFRLDIRVHVDKDVAQALERLIVDLDEIKIWPWRAKDVKFRLVEKIYHPGISIEDKLVYLSQKEFFQVKNQFRSLQHNYYNNWAAKHGKPMAKLKIMYPKVEYVTPFCGSASRPYGLVIDDQGFVHKCWEKVNDKEDRIQHISNYFPDHPDYEKWLDYNKLEDPKCNNCKYFPICDEPCVQHHHDGYFKCSEWKFMLKEHLKNYYLDYIKTF